MMALIRTIACVLVFVFFAPADVFAQPARNSTRKIRVKPSATAKKIGSGVHWQPNLESAIEESKASGKPIFWYVPTLRNSFMDRKPVIDRYMMAGPFSWPTTISVLNEHFVTVKSVPTKEQQKKFELAPFKFVEPGFLVLDVEQNAKLKVDRITTLHEKWFLNLLKSGNPKVVLKPAEPSDVDSAMQAALEVFRSGDHKKAAADWKAISQKYPDHPLAWKAAAEAEGFGPIVRGFEVASDVPEKALKAGVDSVGSLAPKATYSQTEVTRRSVEFLLGMQRGDGGFVDCDYDFGGTDSLPNVHVAVTSLVGMALLSVRSEFPELEKRIDDAIQKAAKYASDDDNIAKSDRDEILWAYAYRTRFLSRLTGRFPEWMEPLQNCVGTLESIKTQKGGWYHEYANPFVTATALTALAEAHKSGAEVDKSKVTEGVAALSGDRFGNGAFPYGSGRGGGSSSEPKPGSERDVAASAGRMPLCELGLWSWGESSDERLASAVKISFDMHKHLNSALKYDDHTSNMGYGGFFFWYDMRGRSEAIARIKDDELRKSLEEKQRGIILELPELDGCFVDSHELGRCYGTAMALLSLDLVRVD